MATYWKVTRECLAVATEADHRTVIMIQPGSKIALISESDDGGLVEALFSNQRVFLQSKDLSDAEPVIEPLAAAAEATA